MLTAGGQTEIVDVGVDASFDGTTISGNAGCNSYHASYEVDGSQISFGPIAATNKICPEDEQSTEDRYLQLLAEIGSYEVRPFDVDERTGRDAGPAVHARLSIRQPGLGGSAAVRAR